ncbi:ribonuclease HII [Candidatus Pacearchaeota archaeon]|nr:ribonuclease HII [Candidatus Pacearchaeota archaeon]
MKFYIGIDEAGRGPIIGPMTFGGVLADEKQIKILKELGVKDSKLLPHPKREFLSVQIKKNVLACTTLAISPRDIDKSLAEKINLNQLEAKKAAEIINFLKKRVDEVEIIVDCPSTNIISWRNYLLQHIKNPEKIKLRCEHKADLNHTIVGAASILAKVLRENEVEKIQKNIDQDIGSGYPSDPTTIEFLKKHSLKFKDSGIFRKSWQTWKDLHPPKSQKKLGDF